MAAYPAIPVRFLTIKGQESEIGGKTMRKVLLLGIAVLLLLLSGCDEPFVPTTSIPRDTPTVAPTKTPTPGVKPDLTAIVRDYPRVDGSSSAHPLQVPHNHAGHLGQPKVRLKIVPRYKDEPGYHIALLLVHTP